MVDFFTGSYSGQTINDPNSPDAGKLLFRVKTDTVRILRAGYVPDFEKRHKVKLETYDPKFFVFDLQSISGRSTRIHYEDRVIIETLLRGFKVKDPKELELEKTIRTALLQCQNVVGIRINNKIKRTFYDASSRTLPTSSAFYRRSTS